jgi:hypothetical protein
MAGSQFSWMTGGAEAEHPPEKGAQYSRDDGFELTTRIDMTRKKQQLAVTDGPAGPSIRAGWHPGAYLQQRAKA